MNPVLLLTTFGAIVGVALYVVARLGAAGRWGSDEKTGEVGPGGAYRAAPSVELVPRPPPAAARSLAAAALIVGAVAVAIAVGLEWLVVEHRLVAVDRTSTVPWLHPSLFDVVVGVAVACGGIVDGIIAASGWSVVRRGVLRRRGGFVFLLATLVHFVIGWSIAQRPAPYTPWAVLYELVGMACVIVGWALAVSKPS